jgi:hypothetical protein
VGAFFMFAKHICFGITVFIFLNWTVSCFAQAEAITIQQVDQLIQQHKDLIDQVQSNVFLEQKMDTAQDLAHYYTNPTTIDNLIHPEKVQQEQQRAFNQQLLYEFAIPINIFSIPVGIYNRDILAAGHIGITWAVEWWFYSAITHTMTELCYQQILSDKDTISPSQVFKKIMGIAVLYAFANTTEDAIKSHFLLNEKMTIPQSQPISISAFLPTKYTGFLLDHLTPQSWILSFNDLFKQIGWLPEWTESYQWKITKECFAVSMWLWWYYNNIATPTILEFKTKNKKLIDQLTAYTHMQAKTKHDEILIQKSHTSIKSLIQKTMHITFSQWTMMKTIRMSFWHSVATIASASSAWIRLGQWIYNTYTMITKTTTQTQKGSS